MNKTGQSGAPGAGGIQFRGPANSLDNARGSFLEELNSLGLGSCVKVDRMADGDGEFVHFGLNELSAGDFGSDFDTMQLCGKLNLDTAGNPDDLAREILLAMLMGPVAFSFPTYDELVSAVRIRRNIVVAARKTALAFDTEEAERPAGDWNYSEARGFVLVPGRPLIESLRKATQPERSGKLYSFSCYRATEYVMLLGLAQELERCNPGLSRRLQEQWETRAIMSGEFHDVFLHEYGTLSEPLPPRYYVPGDRVWFRNPDEHSSNVDGYEGSWVFYIGNGLFTNFWKRDQPFTLVTKCVELYHWRNATYRNGDGKLQIDEDIVEDRVRQSLQDPLEEERILKKMLRLREPAGVYLNGGCVDATREYVCCVRPGTSEIIFPHKNSLHKVVE
jgi:hypothetical protein